jgi:hypothetical protein
MGLRFGIGDFGLVATKSTKRHEAWLFVVFVLFVDMCSFVYFCSDIAEVVA